MTRCPLCSGTGELCHTSSASTVQELHDVQWRNDLRRLLALLHQAVMDDDRATAEAAAEARRQKKASA